MARRSGALWLVLGVLACLLGWQGQAWAQPCPENLKGYIPLDYEALTVSTVAVPFTAAKVRQATGNAAYAFVTVETNTISVAQVGVPTASVGHQWVAGSVFGVCGLDAITAFRAIRVTADATMKVTYYKAR